MGVLLDNAICFAVKAHCNAFRKGTDIPYILHPLEAGAIAASLTANEEIIAAAILHDTLEDTDTTIDVLRNNFGETVTNLVLSDTEDKMKHLSAPVSWNARKKAAIEFLKTASEAEQIITLSDKLSNLRSIYAEYSVKGDELFNKFNQKDKAEHAWYYGEIAANIKDLRETVVYKEFTELLKSVFGN